MLGEKARLDGTPPPLDTEIQLLHEEKEILLAEIGIAKDRIQANNSEKDQLHLQLKRFPEEIKHIEAKTRQVDAEIAHLKETEPSQKANQKIDLLIKSRENYRAQIDLVNKKIERANEGVKNLISDIEKLQEKADSLEAQVHQIDSDLAKVKEPPDTKLAIHEPISNTFNPRLTQMAEVVRGLKPIKN